jgi:hypothetical protein
MGVSTHLLAFSRLHGLNIQQDDAVNTRHLWHELFYLLGHCFEPVVCLPLGVCEDI